MRMNHSLVFALKPNPLSGSESRVRNAQGYTGGRTAYTASTPSLSLPNTRTAGQTDGSSTSCSISLLSLPHPRTTDRASWAVLLGRFCGLVLHLAKCSSSSPKPLSISIPTPHFLHPRPYRACRPCRRRFDNRILGYDLLAGAWNLEIARYFLESNRGSAAKHCGG